MGAKQSGSAMGESPISPVRKRASFSAEDNYSGKADSNIFESEEGFDVDSLSPAMSNKNSEEPSFTYGGNFTWVDSHYKMQVGKGLSPLQWLNGLMKRLLVLSDISFGADGTFIHPRDKSVMFPRKGIDLRWRFDTENDRVIIDFYQDGKYMKWRWDELKAKQEMTFPSTTPDFVGIGHVGKYTFNYEFQSVPPGESFSSDSDTDESVLFRLEPVTREGRNFTWWNTALIEERKRTGAGGGAVFAAPPGDAIIGEGSFGTVWLARDRQNGNCYAVKNVFAKTGRRNNTDRAMAQNEFETCGKILTKPHPNVVAFYALESFVVSRGELYVLVMEYCTSGDLQDIINSCMNDSAVKKYVPPPESLLWIAQMFSAIEHIHTELSMLLRDLKPCNVILSSRRCVKLTDFGFGRLVAESPGGEWTFRVPPSTPGYAAPELLTQEPYSYPVDVYAFGVIAWVLLSGGAREMKVPAPPVGGVGNAFSTYQSDWKLLADALQDKKKARCEIDTSAVEVISEMTQHRPNERPSIQALRDKPFFRDAVLPLIPKTERPLIPKESPLMPKDLTPILE